MKRDEIIRELLRTYNDVVTPLSAGEGDGGGWPRMSMDYSAGSYAELEQALKRMRSQGDQQAVQSIPVRTLWWHLNERYIRCEKRRKMVLVKRKGKNGKTFKQPLPAMVEAFSREYMAINRKRREECEKLGVDWLSGEFDRMGKVPNLPREIYQRVAA